MQFILLIFTCLLISACAGTSTKPIRAHDTNAEPDSVNNWLDTHVFPQLLEELGHNPLLVNQSVSVALHNRYTSATFKAMENRLIRKLESTPGIAFISAKDLKSSRNLYALNCGENNLYTDIILKFDIADKYSTVITLDAYDQDKQQIVNTKLRYRYAPKSLPKDFLESTPQFDRLSPQGTINTPFYEDENEAIANTISKQIACQLNEHWEGNIIRLYVNKFADSQQVDQASISSINNSISQQLAIFDQIQRVENRLKANVFLEQQHHPSEKTNVYKTVFEVTSSDLNREVKIRPFTYIHFNRPPSRNTASITVNLPDVQEETPKPAIPNQVAPSPEKDIIASFEVIIPSDLALCQTNDPWQKGKNLLRNGSLINHHHCFALEVALNENAQIFMLYQDKFGAVQTLLPTRCEYFEDVATDLSAYDVTHFPDLRGKIKALDLDAEGGQESFYLIASQSESLNQKIIERLSTITDICDGTEVVDKHNQRTNTSQTSRSIDIEAWLTSLQPYSDQTLFWAKRHFNY